MSAVSHMARRVSRTGMVDAPAAHQHDVKELGSSLFQQQVKFTDAVLDHVCGLPSVNLPTEFAWELKSWEARQGRDLVRDAVCLLLCSRFGLTGVELKALLHITEGVRHRGRCSGCVVPLTVCPL